jgi:hypothetical protein
MTKTPPPPGSDEAIKLGCSCAIMDNNHGRGAYVVDGKPVFWISGDCIVHSEDCHPDSALQEIDA